MVMFHHCPADAQAVRRASSRSAFKTAGAWPAKHLLADLYLHDSLYLPFSFSVAYRPVLTSPYRWNHIPPTEPRPHENVIDSHLDAGVITNACWQLPRLLSDDIGL